MRLEELLDSVGVPLGDAECLNDISFLVEELDLWVESAQIFDLEILELVGSLGLDEGLDLRVSAELASAHLKNGFWILSSHRPARLFLAAFDALLFDLLEAKVFEIVTGRAKELRLDEAQLSTVLSGEFGNCRRLKMRFVVFIRLSLNQLTFNTYNETTQQDDD